MTDYSELKRLAEASRAANHDELGPDEAFQEALHPEVVMALIAELERYRQYGCGTCDGSGHLHRADGEYCGACTSCGAYELEQAKRERDQLKAENEALRSDLDVCKSGGVPVDCNGSGCGSCWYECHETDHIAGGRNMVTGPVGQIERWFCEGRDAADGAICRYGEHTLAKHWWSRGYSYNQRLARAIVAEAQLNCDPEDFAIDHLNDCLAKIDAAMSPGEKPGD